MREWKKGIDRITKCMLNNKCGCVERPPSYAGSVGPPFFLPSGLFSAFGKQSDSKRKHCSTKQNKESPYRIPVW